VGERFTGDLKTLQQLYDDENSCSVSLSSEEEVRHLLDHTWLRRASRILDKFVQVKGIGKKFKFAGTDTSHPQQLDFHAQLTPIGGVPVTVSLIELKSEGITRKCWKNIIKHGWERAQLDWDAISSRKMADKIILKVCTAIMVIPVVT
jgi:hypothetical protein